MPGPSDYRTVPTDVFRTRRSIIPQMTFTLAGKDPESKKRSEERAKSPGPQHYRIQSATFLSRSPSACFGNTRREIAEKDSKTFRSPGPMDYMISRPVGNGPSYHIAKRYSVKLDLIPGPSDYNFDPNMRLKVNPRITIGNAKKESCLVPRTKSPGPSCYNPEKLILKRKAVGVIFNREKR